MRKHRQVVAGPRRVVDDAVGVRVLAGQEAGAARRAERRRRKRVGEPRAFAGEPIHVRRLDERMSAPRRGRPSACRRPGRRRCWAGAGDAGATAAAGAVCSGAPHDTVTSPVRSAATSANSLACLMWPSKSDGPAPHYGIELPVIRVYIREATARSPRVRLRLDPTVTPKCPRLLPLMLVIAAVAACASPPALGDVGLVVRLPRCSKARG